MTQTETLQTGQIFAGRYQIVKKLGSGGFGAVYLAFQPTMDRHVAIKILSLGHATDDLQRDTARERFLREVRIISKLRHPNSVIIHDFGESQSGDMYMVLEHIDGPTLQHSLNQEGPFDLGRAVDVTTQIADALSEAHDIGIVHRDLKPGNIMLSKLGQRQDYVKVLDFGIAHLLGQGNNSDLTQAGFGEDERAIIGTPRYMSPEQIHGRQELTPASDIYSLGLLFYEMLVGQPAIQTTSTIQIIAQQASPTPLQLSELGSLPAHVQLLLSKMLNKNPMARMQSCAEVIGEIGSSRASIRYSGGFSAVPPSAVSSSSTEQDTQGFELPEIGGSEEFVISNNAPHHAPVHEPSTPSSVYGDQNVSTSDYTRPSIPRPQLTQSPPQMMSESMMQGSIEFDMSNSMPPLELQEDPMAKARALGDSNPQVSLPHAPSAASTKITDILILAIVFVLFCAVTSLTTLGLGFFMGTKFDDHTTRVLAVGGVVLAGLVVSLLFSFTSRERFKVVSSLGFRLRKTLIGATCINFLLAVAVMGIFPKPFVNFLESTPNWFIKQSDPSEEVGLAAMNRKLALETAKTLRVIVGQDVAKDNEVVPTPKNTRNANKENSTTVKDTLPPIKMAPEEPKRRRKVHPGLQKMMDKSKNSTRPKSSKGSKGSKYKSWSNK